MLRYPRVLLLSADEVESSKLEQILSEHVVLRRVKDLSGLQTELEGNEYDALICGWSFNQGAWRGAWHDALEQAQNGCLQLPVIIYCEPGDEAQWREVWEAGGFDLLVAPDQMNTVLPEAEHAITSHDARQFHRARAV